MRGLLPFQRRWRNNVPRLMQVVRTKEGLMRSIVGRVLKTVVVVGAFVFGSAMVGSGCSSSSKSPVDSGTDSHGATGGQVGTGGTNGSGGATATDAGHDGTSGSGGATATDASHDGTPDIAPDAPADLGQDVAVDATTGGDASVGAWRPCASGGRRRSSKKQSFNLRVRSVSAPATASRPGGKAQQASRDATREEGLARGNVSSDPPPVVLVTLNP